MIKEKIKMVIGFVLMHVSPLHEYEVFNTLSKLPEVIEIHPLFGEYDLIVKIQAEDYESIGEIVIHKIKTIEGITDTKTLTGLKLH
jgi:DNA-binding Lrp family transcriptional regulator